VTDGVAKIYGDVCLGCGLFILSREECMLVVNGFFYGLVCQLRWKQMGVTVAIQGASPSQWKPSDTVFHQQDRDSETLGLLGTSFVTDVHCTPSSRPTEVLPLKTLSQSIAHGAGFRQELAVV
jgi:hypothetical protein